MRFSEKSDNIPNMLIDQVYKGKVTFLSGAGVSMLLGLPSFKCLTKLVYEILGENISDEIFEKNSFTLGEYDRTLGLLEKRILIPGLKSAVRSTVADILKLKEKVVPTYHIYLLNLSRDSLGRIRLMTTNFDTLFERAAKCISACRESYALSAMPKPGSDSDFGIFHLHGRIGDDELRLEETDLILTSSDFGNAYLRDIWVSKYIEDRIRSGPLVLVGYSAEDVAMRMLLEAIDADRPRLEDFEKIYALDIRGDNSKELWESKGIEFIGFDDYSAIYETIKEWSIYNTNPDKYIKNEISKIIM